MGFLFFQHWVESRVPLGRVYVDDPDDWNSQGKTYVWSKAHPLFTLDSSTGELSMMTSARVGRFVSHVKPII